MPNNYQTLKEQHRVVRDQQNINLSLRIHRALSWLNLAEQSTDEDSKFIFLWIAFNSAYATDINDLQGLDQQATFNLFLEKLYQLDINKTLDNLVWVLYPKSIRTILDNQYIFKPFWEYQKGNKTEEQWQTEFKKAKQAAHASLGNQNTPVVLSVVLSRIYVLRNQLMHGGATWNSKVNRNQIHDCLNLMDELVPAIITIMLENPNTLWGDANYPPVGN